MVFDDGKKDVVLEKAISFWVFPYKLLGGFIIVLAVVVFALRWLLKRYIKSQVNKGKGS